MKRLLTFGFLGLLAMSGASAAENEYISYEQAYECDIYAALAQVIMEYKQAEAPVRSLLKVNEKFDGAMRSKLDNIVIDAYSRNEFLENPAINDNPEEFKEEYLNYCLSI